MSKCCCGFCCFLMLVWSCIMCRIGFQLKFDFELVCLVKWCEVCQVVVVNWVGCFWFVLIRVMCQVLCCIGKLDLVQKLMCMSVQWVVCVVGLKNVLVEGKRSRIVVRVFESCFKVLVRWIGIDFKVLCQECCEWCFMLFQIGVVGLGKKFFLGFYVNDVFFWV